MIGTMQGLTLMTLALAGGSALHHKQPAGSSAGVLHSIAADTTRKHGGGKHGGGHKHLSFDAATNTVTLKLVAGRPRGTSRLNFNGYSNGKATLVVPPKSHVVLKFVNEDSVPHSAAIIDDRDPLPPATVDRPALPQAATKDLTQGLPAHATDVVRFTAPASGSYRVVSGVPGQGRAGMWIRFTVDPSAKAPAWLKSK